MHTPSTPEQDPIRPLVDSCLAASQVEYSSQLDGGQDLATSSFPLTLHEIALYLRNGCKVEGALRERVLELLKEAPIVPRSVFRREGQRYYLAGTIGAQFDEWQRRLTVRSAADGFIAQAIGAAAVERVMDECEAAARKELGRAGTLAPRRSPGYAGVPLSESHNIIRKLDATRRIGIALTTSNLLVPLKSVTATCEIRLKVEG